MNAERRSLYLAALAGDVTLLLTVHRGEAASARPS